MPKWVNINDRAPQITGTYFCKINGRKEVLSDSRISEYADRYNDVYWLDETLKPVVKGAIIANKYDILDIKMKSLINLFGVKKAETIAKKIGV